MKSCKRNISLPLTHHGARWRVGVHARIIYKIYKIKNEWVSVKITIRDVRCSADFKAADPDSRSSACVPIFLEIGPTALERALMAAAARPRSPSTQRPNPNHHGEATCASASAPGEPVERDSATVPRGVVWPRACYLKTSSSLFLGAAHAAGDLLPESGRVISEDLLRCGEPGRGAEERYWPGAIGQQAMDGERQSLRAGAVRVSRIPPHRRWLASRGWAS